MPIYFRNLPSSEPFTFDSVGNNWIQEAVSRPRGYPFYHYLQTEEGEGIVKIQEKEYLLKENEGILISPSIRHSYKSSPSCSVWKTCFATFTGSLESSISEITGNHPFLLISAEQGASIAAVIREVVLRYQTPPLDSLALSSLCYQLLLLLAGGTAAQAATDPVYQQYLTPVLREMESNYDSPLTIRELSQMVYVTPQYLSRLFRKYLGCSAYEYLTSYRISKARELLLSSPGSEVQEIARQVGFTDSSHFIAMFRKITGVTPLEFRKLN